MKTSTFLALHAAAAAAIALTAGCQSVQTRGHSSVFGKTEPGFTEGDIPPGQTVDVTEKPATRPLPPPPPADVRPAPAPAPADVPPTVAAPAPAPAPAPVVLPEQAAAPATIRPVADIGRPGSYPEFVNVPENLHSRKPVHAAQVNTEGASFPKPVSDVAPIHVGPAPTGPSVPKVKTVHVVQSGETLGHIAQKYHVPSSEILKVNSMGDPNRIRVGQKINIPEYDASKAPRKTTTKASKTVTAPEGGSVHTVAAGEMISGIAHKYGVKTGDVLRANGLTEESARKIHVGQQLVIPAKTAANTYVAPAASDAPKAPAASTTPAIQPLSLPSAQPTPAPAPQPTPAPVAQPAAPAPATQPTAVARPVAVPVAQPAPAAVPATAPVSIPSVTLSDTAKTYVVQEGDDAVSLARRFGTTRTELLRLNGIPFGTALVPGQTIKLP